MPGEGSARAAGPLSPFAGTSGSERLGAPSEHPQDRPFDPYRSPRTDKARAIVEEVAGQLERYEEHHGLRKRRRKPQDRAVFLEVVAAIACSAMHRELEEPGGRVMVSLSKAGGPLDRYSPPRTSEALPDILERMASAPMGWIEFTKGHQGSAEGPGRRSTFAIGPRLRDRMEEHEVTFGDLGRRPGSEVVVLKRAKHGHADDGGRIDYEDTPETAGLRVELETINAWLEAADLGFAEHLAPWGPPVDTGDRQLVRVFNEGSFEFGGRLYGGFWQGLPKVRRRAGLVIERRRGVELDFGQMGARILYGMAGAIPPAGDLYDVPSLEGYRKAVKKLFNAVLFDPAPRSRYPKRTAEERRWERETGTRVYPYMPAVDAVELILSHHAPVRHLVDEPRIGFRIMRVESTIIVAALLRLRDAEVVALPVHDALVVPSPYAATGRRIMEEVFREIAGVDGVVAEKG